MPKKKEEVKVADATPEPVKVHIPHVTETFGYGELNILRDKVNEIISHLNK